MSNAQRPIEVFCSYAHKDTAMLLELEVHLSALRRQGPISIWHKYQVAPGTDRASKCPTK